MARKGFIAGNRIHKLVHYLSLGRHLYQVVTRVLRKYFHRWPLEASTSRVVCTGSTSMGVVTQWRMRDQAAKVSWTT